MSEARNPKASPGAPAPAAPVYHTPADMTDEDSIRRMVRWGERALERGYRALVVDMSAMRDVNSALLAGLILLSRRTRPLGAQVRLVGAPARFESLMKVYRVDDPLSQAGVYLDRDGEKDPPQTEHS